MPIDYATTDYAVNIMRVYRTIPADILARDWYTDAHNLAVELSPNDVWRGAGVISALSPRKRWNINVAIARVSFETGIAQGNMPMHNAKAQAILDGANPLDIQSAKTSPKTRSFTIAIATRGNGEVATIDCHAHDIAVGRVCAEKERRISTNYADIAAAYREVADYLGKSVNAIQAWTWEWWRIEKGIA